MAPVGRPRCARRARRDEQYSLARGSDGLETHGLEKKLDSPRRIPGRRWCAGRPSREAVHEERAAHEGDEQAGAPGHGAHQSAAEQGRPAIDGARVGDVAGGEGERAGADGVVDGGNVGGNVGRTGADGVARGVGRADVVERRALVPRVHTRVGDRGARARRRAPRLGRAGRLRASAGGHPGARQHPGGLRAVAKCAGTPVGRGGAAGRLAGRASSKPAARSLRATPRPRATAVAAP